VASGPQTDAGPPAKGRCGGAIDRLAADGATVDIYRRYGVTLEPPR
jgi:hypothetical protein